MNANFTAYNPLSSTLKCTICGNDLATCSCNKVSITSNSAFMSANSSYGSISGSGYTTTQTYFLNCNGCGQPLANCQCNLINHPPTTPNILIPSTWTWSGTSLDSGTIYSYLKVLDVESKVRYDHSGFFKVERKNEQDGIYGNLSGLILPVDFKEVFALIRKEDQFKVWQIRAPLTFQVDFQLDANKEESHFFTLVSVKDVEVGEKIIVVTEPRFQEVPNPIDLCQIIEIQRVFIKLLRRI